MSAGMQQVTRQQLPSLQGTLLSMGELKSVTFTAGDAQGGDVYDVQFANGALNFSIMLDDEGKTIGAGLRMAPSR